MQRLTCAAWSLDDRFIYSGSDEMNIRIWKARAAEKLGVVSSLLHTFLFGSASLQYAKIVCFVYFRLNLERGQLCKSTLNWLKNSSTIQLSKRFNVTDTCPSMFTTPGTNYVVAELQPDESTNYFFKIIICCFFNENFLFGWFSGITTSVLTRNGNYPLYRRRSKRSFRSSNECLFSFLLYYYFFSSY